MESINFSNDEKIQQEKKRKIFEEKEKVRSSIWTKNFIDLVLEKITQKTVNYFKLTKSQDLCGDFEYTLNGFLEKVEKIQENIKSQIQVNGVRFSDLFKLDKEIQDLKMMEAALFIYNSIEKVMDHEKFLMEFIPMYEFILEFSRSLVGLMNLQAVTKKQLSIKIIFGAFKTVVVDEGSSNLISVGSNYDITGSLSIFTSACENLIKSRMKVPEKFSIGAHMRVDPVNVSKDSKEYTYSIIFQAKKLERRELITHGTNFSKVFMLDGVKMIYEEEVDVALEKLDKLKKTSQIGKRKREVSLAESTEINIKHGRGKSNLYAGGKNNFNSNNQVDSFDPSQLGLNILRALHKPNPNPLWNTEIPKKILGEKWQKRYSLYLSFNAEDIYNLMYKFYKSDYFLERLSLPIKYKQPNYKAVDIPYKLDTILFYDNIVMYYEFNPIEPKCGWDKEKDIKTKIINKIKNGEYNPNNNFSKKHRGLMIKCQYCGLAGTEMNLEDDKSFNFDYPSLNDHCLITCDNCARINFLSPLFSVCVMCVAFERHQAKTYNRGFNNVVICTATKTKLYDGGVFLFCEKCESVITKMRSEKDLAKWPFLKKFKNIIDLILVHLPLPLIFYREMSPYFKNTGNKDLEGKALSRAKAAVKLTMPSIYYSQEELNELLEKNSLIDLKSIVNEKVGEHDEDESLNSKNESDEERKYIKEDNLKIKSEENKGKSGKRTNNNIKLIISQK